MAQLTEKVNLKVTARFLRWGLRSFDLSSLLKLPARDDLITRRHQIVMKSSTEARIPWKSCWNILSVQLKSSYMSI